MSARSLFVFIAIVVCSVGAGRLAAREFERTFPVQPGCIVKVDTYRGSITVVEGERPEVVVAVSMDVATDNEADAARAYETLQLEAAEANNTVTLRARNSRESGVRFVWQDKLKINLSWRITVPRECSVDLTTMSGAITVGSLTGRVVARTEAGTISIKRIDGSIDARNGVGDVIISRCSGPTTVRVLRGLIRVGTMGGPTDLKNMSGDVEVLAATAGLTASAEAGDVYVGFPRETAGDARVTTAGGSIYAKIHLEANCAVVSSAVWGRVESLLPIAVESGAKSRNRLVGRLGTGGPTLTLRADGGHVKLTPGEAFLD